MAISPSLSPRQCPDRYGCRLSGLRSPAPLSSEKRSLPPAFKNDEYEVRETTSTMDPLTPNRVAFPSLAGVACVALLRLAHPLGTFGRKLGGDGCGRKKPKRRRSSLRWNPPPNMSHPTLNERKTLANIEPNSVKLDARKSDNDEEQKATLRIPLGLFLIGSCVLGIRQASGACRLLFL
ncbi:hypothetical protein M9H77_23631 [Catharanthus roseus]|uniref:Uncharacterized protein n=1 Tax=Catharanthus roseus TaxID=4058 RepID=A0ACC0AWP0_CATRO|nr:hypothetical protein M9H77_23631 [Catharanthus roseus]